MSYYTHYFRLFAAATLSLCVLVQNSYSWLVDPNKIPEDYPYSEECSQEYSKIQQDCLLNTVEKKLEAWSKYKTKCSKNGIYEGHKAMFYILAGDGNKAIGILQESLKNPDYNIIENASLLASIFYEAGYFLETKKWAEILIGKYPDYCNGYALLGQYYIAYRNWEYAKHYLEKANRLNDEVSAVQAYLAVVYYQYARNEEVVNLYYKAYNTEPCKIIFLRRPTVSMIAALIHLGRLEEAQKFLNEQLEKDPAAKDDYGHKVVKQELEKALIAREIR